MSRKPPQDLDHWIVERARESQDPYLRNAWEDLKRIALIVLRDQLATRENP